MEQPIIPNPMQGLDTERTLDIIPCDSMDTESAIQAWHDNKDFVLLWQSSILVSKIDTDKFIAHGYKYVRIIIGRQKGGPVVIEL